MVLDSRSHGYRVRCRHCILLNFGVLAKKSSPNSNTFQPIPVVRPTDALPLPSESQPLFLIGRYIGSTPEVAKLNLKVGFLVSCRSISQRELLETAEANGMVAPSLIGIQVP